jgi:hypothetical protein
VWEQAAIPDWADGYADAVDAALIKGANSIERADHDVVPVRITDCKLFGSGIRVHVRLLFESGD